ncbi:MAG: signal peptide peptidase SppA [Planctomycetaceae bacterium]
MADKPLLPATPGPDDARRTTIVIQQPSSRTWMIRALFVGLLISLLFNAALFVSFGEYYGVADGPNERYHSGDKSASERIAIVEINGTISPPFTGRILKAIQKARHDDDVKGVLLAIDSPGGLVADSHMIYHELELLRQKKPIAVIMKRLAASGGLYAAMGVGNEGRIFAEPTTWTGSIGVIIPHYDLSGLAQNMGIKAEPLKTGELKDALSPFRELGDKEREVWTVIMDEAFQRFITVIDDNRDGLDRDRVLELATGQVYTAQQALDAKLIDAIGFEEDAIAHLKQHLQLDEVRVVRYETPPALIDLLTGAAEAQRPEAQWQSLMELTVPRAMYYCSWLPELGGLHRASAGR